MNETLEKTIEVKPEVQALARAYVEDWHRDLPHYIQTIPLFGHVFRVGEVFRDGLTLKYLRPSNKTLRKKKRE